MSTADGYDYVVVGAGSAGCVLAHRLSEDEGATVLLLEAGGHDRHPYIQIPLGLGKLQQHKMFDWGYTTEPEPHLNNVGSRCCEAKFLAVHRRSMSWAIPAATAPISTDGRAKVPRDGPSRMRCPISGEAKPGRMARTPGAAAPVPWAHNGPGRAIHFLMAGARRDDALDGPLPRMPTGSSQSGSGAASLQSRAGGERRRRPLI